MSFSDISDLTNLSSEDDVPLAKPSQAKKGPKEYRITHVLRAPRTAQYTAKSLYDQIIDNSIDLDPEYQRDVVWQEEKQSGLIDSILRNYYIPPIIFAVTVQDDGSELRTCIDGKQRLTSIQRFMDGQIPHKDSFTNEKLWFKSTATNARRKLLPQHMRTLFANKQIVCVEYSELNADQEREIFQRVQLGVALTPAERLQALVGPWSTVIHEIQNQVLGDEGFEGYLDWGHARGRDFQCLATIGYFIENHPKTAIPGAKTLEKWLQKTQPVPTRLRTDLRETFRIFVILARDRKYSASLNRPTRVSPIEFVMIGVLIYLKRQNLSLTQLSSAAENMRKDVRASHQDIRSNTRVTKHMMEFMTKKITVSDLNSDGEGDIPAALAIAKSPRLIKRKRTSYSDDSDTELSRKVQPTKPSGSTGPVKSSKQASGTDDQKSNGTRISVTASESRTTSNAASTIPSATNNSLSNLLPTSAPKSSIPASAVHVLHGQFSPPPSMVSNHSSGHLRPAASNSVHHSSLTLQTGLMMKAESPQMNMLNSPAVLSAADRLAPIRVAKATFASGNNLQSHPSNDLRVVFNPSPNASEMLVDLQQQAFPPRPVVHQTAVSSPQQPPGPLPALSQLMPANMAEGRAAPARVEEVLQNLRSQFPQLVTSRAAPHDSVDSAAVGPNVQAKGVKPLMLPSAAIPPSVNNTGYIYQGHNVGGAARGAYNRNTIPSQANLSQPHRPYVTSPWPPTNPGMLAVTAYQQPPNFSLSTPAGPHALPPRPPPPPTAPRNNMRAEPLGPASFEGGYVDWRGPHSNDRHHPWDDRRSNIYSRSHDDDRDKRHWHRPRP